MNLRSGEGDVWGRVQVYDDRGIHGVMAKRGGCAKSFVRLNCLRRLTRCYATILSRSARHDKWRYTVGKLLRYGDLLTLHARPHARRAA